MSGSASADDGLLSVAELVAETTSRLATVADLGDAAPRWLVAECCGLDDDELVAAANEPVTVGAVGRVDVAVARLVAGEPLQYVLGHWAFRNLDLMVDRRVLIPRPETEQLVDLVLRWIGERSDGAQQWRVLDLGCGSGAIGLAVAEECSSATVTMTDQSQDAIDVARANLAGIGRAAARVRICQGDWFAALPADEVAEFDVIVANPPYIADEAELEPRVADWEPREALRSGVDGLSDLRRIITDASEYASSTALLAVECGDDHASDVAELFRGHGWSGQVVADLAGRSRFVVGERSHPPTDRR